MGGVEGKVEQDGAGALAILASVPVPACSKIHLDESSRVSWLGLSVLTLMRLFER